MDGASASWRSFEIRMTKCESGVLKFNGIVKIAGLYSRSLGDIAKDKGEGCRASDRVGGWLGGMRWGRGGEGWLKTGGYNAG
jgi:hypothetical protein